ncbi:hypothetical protein HMPREF9056_01406 [Actinomyces sp. oral taxon 170 str. F0386]|nr:hypothetical protein HMPREF9056_01406 [Actinomyces sp. oral taxon 170 str. F0386]
MSRTVVIVGVVMTGVAVAAVSVGVRRVRVSSCVDVPARLAIA